MKSINKKIKITIFICFYITFGLYAQEENSFSENPTKEITTKMPFSRGNEVTITVEEIDNKLIYQGDIIIELEQTGRGAAGSTDSDFRWLGARIPFVIARNHPKSADILSAIQYINSNTNVCLTPRVSENDFVEFVYVSGICGRSRIGKRPSGGKQKISIGNQCGSTTRGSVIHEVMHTLGFYHEQSRDDRNNHITINFENILPGKAHNFERYNRRFWHYFFPEGQNIGNYDYSSLMHYGANAFGKPALGGGKMVTIVTKRSRDRIGQRNRLSTIDIRGINTLYPTACSSESSDEQNNSSTVNSSPTNNSSINDNVAIDISHDNVQLVPQTTRVSCWAAAAAMIVGNIESLSVNPEDIANGIGGWKDYFFNSGLPPDNVEMFSLWGLKYEYPQCYTVEGFANLLEIGPLWVATDLGGGAHVIVVTAMRGDGTPNGTILTILDPWEKNMTHFRPSNSGSTYQLTYQEFIERQETLARSEASIPGALYIAY